MVINSSLRTSVTTQQRTPSYPIPCGIANRRASGGRLPKRLTPSQNLTIFSDTIQHLRTYANTAMTQSYERDGLPRPSLNGVQACDINTNNTLREALKGTYGGYFNDASHKEFNSLLHFRTWELRHLPSNRKDIGCKWVFKVKAKEDGSVDTFKARLVIQGFCATTWYRL